MAGKGVGLKVAAGALALSVPLVLVACSGPSNQSASSAAAKARAAAAGRNQAANLAPTVALLPQTNSTRVPVSVEIGTAVTGGIVSDVSLVSATGKQIAGEMRPGGDSWIPDSPLQYNQRYTATVTVIGAGDRTSQATTTFTTVPKPATRPIQSFVNVSSGQTYGVAMPIVVDFGSAIPSADRAAVQSRLFVSSSPAQVGAWRWYSDTEVVYRPRSYWLPGTQVTFRSALGGVPVGNRFIGQNMTATATIGRDMEMAVTNNNHMITVRSDGKVLHQFPISMGKPSTPSWSGQFVIMNRLYATVFDTLDMGPGGYRVAVNYAERLTWSGMFLHSAPWSVYAQGHFNVSHGCVNIGPANAKWIYQNALVGDPVSVNGTPRHVAPGNGWTAWDMSWDDYIKDAVVPLTVSVPSTYSAAP